MAYTLEDEAATRRAIAHKAQAHRAPCRCIICRAAAGDERAEREIHLFIEQWREPPEDRDPRSETVYGA